MMIFVNAFTNLEAIPISAIRTFLVLLNPFAPHISSELWQQLKSPGEITGQRWPGYDAQVLVEDEIDIVLQVNGKVRDRIKSPLDAPRKPNWRRPRARMKKCRMPWPDRQVRKVVVVPNKLVNVVAG